MRKAYPKSIVASKVHRLNFGWFIVYSGIPQMQGTSIWLWSLLLRLPGEISLSLLCLHSSWDSALDLTPPLLVGHMRASVPHLDRTGLNYQLIRGLWLTQARKREGYRMHTSLRQQRPVWYCNSLRHDVCSPREVFPRSQDPGSGGLHRLPGGELWIVTCACTQVSWWLQQQP